MSSPRVDRRRTVAVIGPGDCTDPGLLRAARDVGAGLADAGYAVVTGGLGGVMAAAGAGAAEHGGTVIGVLPGTDANAANDAVTIALPTGLGQGRNVVVASADAVIAIGGSWGTLSEIALARRMNRPVVVLDGWRVDGPPAGDQPIAATDAAAAVREVVSRLS
ncbi:MAG: TIGR00725 family protein [Frankiales bacterium]|nr:TIGR00725 family protein [Frankiales bacterium]